MRTAELSDGWQGEPYSDELIATDTGHELSWSVRDGSLPDGLQLDRSTGHISGTPVGVGSTFTIEVASEDGRSASRQLELTVHPSCDNLGSGDAPVFAPGLEEGVRLQLGLPGDAQLTCGSVSSLTELEIEFSEIGPTLESLGGLTHLSALTDLRIRGAPNLRDINGLAALPQLKFLSISGGQKIDDLSPLSELKELEFLAIRSRALEDLGPLSGLHELTDLYLESDAIRDLSPLGGLSALRLLSIEGNGFQELSALGELSGLEALALTGTYTDLDPLAALSNLETLALYGPRSSDSSTRFSDIGPLESLTGLTALTIERSGVADLRPIEGLHRLGFLELKENNISDVESLAGLQDLWRLDVSGNRISELGPLSSLPSLRSLRVDDNPLTGLDGLGGLPQLEQLSAREGNITDLTALGPAASEQSALSLRDLDLAGNSSLQNIDPLLQNPDFGPGDRIDLRSTSVSALDKARLEGKGVTVDEDIPSF